MNRTRIIYAEDHAAFRVAVARELESFPVRILVQVSNGRELLDKMNLKPDVVLLDLQMPVMNGNQVLEQITRNWPLVKVIIVSMHYEELLVENYLARGARGYISKASFAGDISLLVTAIKKVAAGETYVSHEPLEREKFTFRQKQIVPLLVEGLSGKEISEEVGIAQRSVEKQKQRIYSKVGGARAIDFYRYAFSKGLQFLGRKSK